MTKHKLNQLAKSYDSTLFATGNEGQPLIIWRDMPMYEFSPTGRDGEGYTYAGRSRQFVLALTDTWDMRGRPIEWGWEPVRAQLAAMDSHNNGRDLLSEVRSHNESIDKYQKNKRLEHFRDVADRARYDIVKACNIT